MKKYVFAYIKTAGNALQTMSVLYLISRLSHDSSARIFFGACFVLALAGVIRTAVEQYDKEV